MSHEPNSPEKQDILDRRYLRMAAIWAENSYCQRRQVGAIIVKDKMIISDGYNGTPAGFEKCVRRRKWSNKAIRITRRSKCHNKSGMFKQFK